MLFCHFKKLFVIFHCASLLKYFSSLGKIVIRNENKKETFSISSVCLFVCHNAVVVVVVVVAAVAVNFLGGGVTTMVG